MKRTRPVRHIRIPFLAILALVLAVIACAPAVERQRTDLRFEISFPPEVSSEPLTGRMFLAIARAGESEPRLQVGRYGVPVYGVDFDNLAPDTPVSIDADTLGWPIETLDDFPPGDYYVQAVLNRYTRFERSDGHVLWIHNDQWEGQNWRRSPGNAVSTVQQVHIDPADGGTYRFEVAEIIPPIVPPEDTAQVQRIKMQSDILTEFWGEPMYIGATVLLPAGYDDNPDLSYPTVYQQGHFSLRNPFGYGGGNEFTEAWDSDDFPRFLAVTIQHPTPYFDD